MNPPTISSPPVEPVGDPRPAATPAEVAALFSRLGLSVLVLTVATVLGQNGLDLLLIQLVPGYLTSWWRSWVLSLIPLYALALPLMFLTLRKVPIAPHNADCTVGGEKSLKPRLRMSDFFILLFIGFGAMYVGSLVGNILMALLSALTDYPYANALGSMVNDSPTWMILLGTCICAPIGEELIFRKLLIDRARRFGDAAAILFSGLSFGLFHGNLFQMFYATLLGMILAYLYTRTGRLSWCMAMHAIVNLLGSVIMPLIAAQVPTAPTATLTPIQLLATLATAGWTYGCIIIGTVFLCVMWSRRRLSVGSRTLRAPGAKEAALLNPGMLAATVALVAMTVLNLIPAP